MALNRNFRTTYYKTLGVPVVQHIVDIEASYAALFNEPVVNMTQLVKLALEVGIATSYREPAWQLLTDVLPPYKAVWEFAVQQRSEMYQDVVDAVQVLQQPLFSRCHHQQHSADGQSDSRDHRMLERNDENGELGAIDDTVMREEDTQIDFTGDADNRKQMGKIVSREHLHRLIERHRIYWREILVREPLRGMDDEQYLMGIASVVCGVLNGEMEQFWCFVRLLEVCHEGLELVDPPVQLSSLYSLTVTEFESLFIRMLQYLKTISSRI